MVGPEPRRCVFAILILGYTFDVTLISLLLSSLFCRALEFRVTFVIAWVDAIIGLGATISTCVFLGFVNPDVCEEFERRLQYAFYANTTSDAFRRWLREARCLEMAECAVYAHTYVAETCAQYFDENLALACCGTALLVIGVVCVAFTHSREEEAEEEEEEDGD
jgi:hypothetical protein